MTSVNPIAAVSAVSVIASLASLRGTKQSSALIVWIASFLAMTASADGKCNDGKCNDGKRRR
ncbi:MAG: hypothetical protein LBT42_06195 [Tannerella sp.]|nr:hypothetical protein [Tannerella sp.]